MVFFATSVGVLGNYIVAKTLIISDKDVSCFVMELSDYVAITPLGASSSVRTGVFEPGRSLAKLLDAIEEKGLLRLSCLLKENRGAPSTSCSLIRILVKLRVMGRYATEVWKRDEIALWVLLVIIDKNEVCRLLLGSVSD